MKPVRKTVSGRFRTLTILPGRLRRRHARGYDFARRQIGVQFEFALSRLGERL